MATLKKDSSGRITAASADDFVNLLAPPKKSTYDEDMERVTKGMNLPSKPLPSNYPVGQTDASGMTLMPSGNWSNAAGQETPYHKPTITSPPTDEEVESKKKGGKIKKYSQGGSTAGAGRGGQGGPTAEQMAERNSPNYMTPETERQLKAERDERLQQAKINEAYEAATQNKKKGGKITHYKSASAAVKAAEKRGDKSITVFFSHASKRADGIAQRGHTKGRMR
jgi:hypothetical protein